MRETWFLAVHPSSTSAQFSKVKVNSTKCIVMCVGALSLYQIVAASCNMVAISLCTMLSVMASKMNKCEIREAFKTQTCFFLGKVPNLP